MKTFCGAPTIFIVVAISVLMLNPSINIDCLESTAFQAVNPLWLRWVQEQRNPESASASVSVLAFPSSEEDGKVARGERTIQTRSDTGLAFFNDFNIEASSSTLQPEATTLEQPLFFNRVTFANLLERARQRTSEETTLMIPLSTSESLLFTTTPSSIISTFSASTEEPTTRNTDFYTKRASSRYQPRAIGKSQEFQRLIKAMPYVVVAKRRQNSARTVKRTTLSTTTATPTSTTTELTTTAAELATTTVTLVTVFEEATTEEVAAESSHEVTDNPYEPETTTLQLAQLILSGQYHESNPGQYYEINPGQYHEVNPGQYTEVNPGQYNEENPGQYIEEDQQQQATLDDVKVEVQHTEDAKIYNVQSKVDKFIIGEYGTISKESGQTLHGVRYTAVADVSVDPNLIYQTLIKYFPMEIDFTKKRLEASQGFLLVHIYFAQKDHFFVSM